MIPSTPKIKEGMEREDEIVLPCTEDAFEVELRIFTTLSVDVKVGCAWRLPALRWFAVSKLFFRTFAS